MIKLFTHTDLDGVGCAVLAHMYFNEEDLDITYCNYDDVNENVDKFFTNNEHDKYQNVFITDISINDELASKINTFNNAYPWKYVLLDHHPTALELNKYYWCNVAIENDYGIKTSGTELFFKYLGSYYNDVQIRRFVEVVRDYDTWRWTTLEDGEICKQINDLFYIYGKDKFITWTINQLRDEKFPTFTDVDVLLLNNKQKEIDDYVSSKNESIRIVKYEGYNVGVVFADKYTSELGNRLCEMHTEIDFVIIINLSECTVSYRTIRNDIDLGKDIAAKHGGGGHPKAAGSQFSKSVQLDIIATILFNDEDFLGFGMGKVK